MPEILTSDEAFGRLIFGKISQFVVQLMLCTREGKFLRFGSGIVLCCDNNYYGIITTTTYDPGENNQLFVKYKDRQSMKAMIFQSTGILLALIVYGDDLLPIPCLDKDSSFEEMVVKNDPVWVVGCSISFDCQSFSSGLVSLVNCRQHENVEYFVKDSSDKVVMKTKNCRLNTFMHSCCAGNVLLGAPLVDRSMRVIGINYSRHDYYSRLNHGIKLGQIKAELCELLETEAGIRLNPDRTKMSTIVFTLKECIHGHLEMNGYKLKREDPGASSSLCMGKLICMGKRKR